MKKIREAAPMRNDQMLAFKSFEETIPVELVVEWRTAVELWEKDSNAPNPFKTEKRCKHNLFRRFLFDNLASFRDFGAFSSDEAGRRGRREGLGSEHGCFIGRRSPIYHDLKWASSRG
jgi:hypothetical protein